MRACFCLRERLLTIVCRRSQGLLVFDFVSNVRAPLAAESVTDDELDADLHRIGIDADFNRRGPDSKAGQSLALVMLQFHLLATYRYFSCRQVLRIMDKFPRQSGDAIVDVVVSSYCRIVDFEEFDSTMTIALSAKQWEHVQRRTGYERPSREPNTDGEDGGDDDGGGTSKKRPEGKQQQKKKR